MRIAVSSDNDRGLESSVSGHFGRCPYFTVVNVENGKIESTEIIANPYFNSHTPGQVPAFINSLKANIMISGGMGRRAIMMFQQFGIESVTGGAGSIDRAVKFFLDGSLSGTTPCRESVSHYRGDEVPYEKDEIGRLREEAESLLNEMDRATKRLSTNRKD